LPFLERAQVTKKTSFDAVQTILAETRKALIAADAL
jgi:hypothetical protein